MTLEASAAGEIPPPYTYAEAFNPASVNTALENMRSCLERGLPTFEPSPHIKRAGRLIIVGGGPSLVNEIDALKSFAGDKSNRVICLNDCQSWLAAQGIMPWGSVFMEVEEWPAAFLDDPLDITYLVASHCHSSAFDKLAHRNVVVWHALDKIGEQEVIGDATYVAGGHTAALRTLNLGLLMGFEHFELFGLDSSFEDQSHAYYDAHRGKRLIDISFNGRDYKTLPYLAQQADEFRRWCINWSRLCEIKTHGDGLLQDIHRTMFPQFYL